MSDVSLHLIDQPVQLRQCPPKYPFVVLVYDLDVLQDLYMCFGVCELTDNRSHLQHQCSPFRCHPIVSKTKILSSCESLGKVSSDILKVTEIEPICLGLKLCCLVRDCKQLAISDLQCCDET